MNHTTQNILNKIKKDNIKPTSRFYFFLKHSVLWVPYVVVTFIGIVAVAGVLFAVTHSGWEYREFVYPDTSSFIFASLPIVWIITFSLFSVLVVKALRTTHAGYRLSLKTILFGSMVTSVVLGFVVYEIDDFFKVDSFIRYPVHDREKAIWDTPSEGRLIGFIEEIDDISAKSITVRDMKGDLWTIDISNLGTTTFPFIKEATPARFIGSSTDEHVFVACIVLPWEIGGVTRPERKMGGARKMLNKSAVTPECKEILSTLRQFPHKFRPIFTQ